MYNLRISDLPRGFITFEGVFRAFEETFRCSYEEG